MASKLGLRPRTVSPSRQISPHEISQTFAMFCLRLTGCSCLLCLKSISLHNRFLHLLSFFCLWENAKTSKQKVKSKMHKTKRGKQKSCSPKRTAHCIISDYARVTLPERRQRVQTFTRFTSPSTIARTVCTLGFHAALVWRLEWLTLLPDMMPLPHTSQICAIWFDLLHRISI